MQVRADEKALDLRVVASDVPATIDTDEQRLKQILINLLGNAIKFTDKGFVQFEVEVNERGDRLYLHVEDTGVGMSAEQIQTIFDPFTQGDPSVSRKFGGTGLGLAITKRLVDMLDGTLSVKSELGAGSTFSVEIPISVLHNVQRVSLDLNDDNIGFEIGAEPASLLKLACNVLLVDDQQDIRSVTRHFLEEAGAEVTLAENGAIAVNRVRQAEAQRRQYDVIVMDMQMPEVDGYTATSQLRESGFTMPIIALTANAMQGDRERCVQAGCDDYLAKPIDHAELVKMIDRMTAGVEQEQALNKPQTPDRDAHAEARVLIIEDNADAATATAKLLELNGFGVEIAHTGEAGLDMAESLSPDCVLLDLGLPDMEGSDVAQRLRASDYQGLLIAVSGRSAHEVVGKAEDSSFDHYLVKPVKFDKLRALLQGVREKSPSVQRN